MKAFFRFIKDVLLKNWGLKLTSILLAFALWLMVRGSGAEQVYQVPLIVQIPPNMEIVNERPSTVEITAQGPMANLAGGQPNMTYNIDLQSAGEGVQTVPLSPSGVRISPASGFKVVRVSPARLTLVLEKVISKDVAIKVPVRGAPAPGFDLYGLTCTPNAVRISGPRSDITPMKVVETQPVSVAARNQSFSTTVNFNLQNDDIHTSPVAAEVNVELGPHRETRTLRVPVTVLDDSTFAASPPTVTVSVLVPVTFKGRLTAQEFQASAAVPSPAPPANKVTVRVNVDPAVDLGAGITIKQVNPEEVTLFRKARKK